jgi:hypothetical protein
LKTKISKPLGPCGQQNYFLKLILNGVLKTAPFYNIYFRRITGVLEFGLPRFGSKNEISKPLSPCGQQNYFLKLILNGVLKTAPFYNIYFRRITGILEFGLPRFGLKNEISKPLSPCGQQNYFLKLILNGILKTAPFYNIYFRRITGVLEFGLPRFGSKTEISKPLGPCGQQNYFL